MTLPIRLYNSLTKSVETFSPVHDGIVRMYSCGPTVYDTAHIGNLRAFIAADTLQRTLRTIGGYDVRWVMNVTDIDDKTIDGSARGSVRWKEDMGPQTGDALVDLRTFTMYFERLFKADIQAVGIRQDHFFAMPRATDYIKDMQELILDIVRHGVGYVSDGSVYFSTSAYRNLELPDGRRATYGRIFQIDEEHFREGVRIDADEYDRESVSDFVLWKGRKGQEPYWDFEVDGQNVPGRPGWHIECSAMSKVLLGLPFDIHTGGVDLRFPHHEDELAQCTAGYHSHDQAMFWFHNEFLEVEGRKMSKSLGNFFVLSDLVQRGLDPLDIRYAMMSAHYRSVYNFTFENVSAMAKGRRRIQETIWKLIEHGASRDGEKQYHSDVPSIASVFERFADDLHTPTAMSELYGYVSSVDAVMNTMSDSERNAALADLSRVNDVVAVWSFDARPTHSIPARIQQLADERWAARSAKNWAESDRLRDVLASEGWSVKDGAAGYVLEPRS